MRIKSPVFMDVENRTLPDLTVIHRFILFHDQALNPDPVIRPTFRALRARLAGFGLDPDTLLHVGVPELADGQLVSYDCCLEYPLPDNNDDLKILPGGRYAVLTVEKSTSKIGPAIRTFRGDYLPDHGLIPDEQRPVYEIYFKETMEYCVPIR
jgi:DNA gyrase inhibitor GyrI